MSDFLLKPLAGEVLTEYVLNKINGEPRKDIQKVHNDISIGHSSITDYILTDNDLRWLLLNADNNVTINVVNHIRNLVDIEALKRGYIDDDE